MGAANKTKIKQCQKPANNRAHSSLGLVLLLLLLLLLLTTFYCVGYLCPCLVYLKNESFLLKTVTEREETSKDEFYLINTDSYFNQVFLMALFYLLIKTPTVVQTNS